MPSKQPRKQRKALHQAPAHVRAKQMRAPLSRELREKYGRRNVILNKGDTARIVRGDSEFRGEEGRILKVDRKHYRVEVEGITQPTARGSQVPRPIHPSNVVITRLDTEDEARIERIQSGGDS